MSNPSYTPKQILEARNELWRKGILWWKLDTSQLTMYEFAMNTKVKTTVINASRRIGKSHTCTILALEMCIKNPGSIVKYIQPTKTMLRDNLIPDMEILLEDCPLDVRPVFHKQQNTWIFPNGSRINMAGTDGKNYEKLRGGRADLCIIDEAGFCTDLRHIITYILLPLTTNTGGKIILASTTPTEPDHEFIDYMNEAKENDAFIKKTVFQYIDEIKDEENPRLTNKAIGDIISGYIGGVESDAFRTEYLCEIITNSSNSVLPEWTEEIERNCVMDVERPQFYDIYTSMDIGFKDYTFVIFGYWNYDLQKLVIVDEYVQRQGTTEILGKNINRKELLNWGENLIPYRRVADNNNLLLLEDLKQDPYFLFFRPTQKHDKITYITQLRTMIGNEQIIISPKCEELIKHIKFASWNKDKTDFKRSSREDDAHHYDGVSALLYLSRNIERTRDPYPAGWRTRHVNHFNSHINGNYKSNDLESGLLNIIRPKTSLIRKK